MTKTLLFLLVAYLFGALPVGLLVGRMVKGIDVREHGSGNIGASNVWRTLGPFWGVAVFIFDFGKGFIPTQRAVQVALEGGGHPWLPVLVGLAAILGHNFSVFLRFKGGKGVATSLGVVCGLSPLAGLIGFAVWGVVLGVTRYISVASMVGAVVTAALLAGLFRDLPHALFALLVALFVLLKHRPNVSRLRAGTEPKVGRAK